MSAHRPARREIHDTGPYRTFCRREDRCWSAACPEAATGSARLEPGRAAVEHGAQDAEVDTETVDDFAHDVDVLAHVVTGGIDERARRTHRRDETHHVARATR